MSLFASRRRKIERVHDPSVWIRPVSLLSLPLLLVCFALCARTEHTPRTRIKHAIKELIALTDSRKLTGSALDRLAIEVRDAALALTGADAEAEWEAEGEVEGDFEAIDPLLAFIKPWARFGSSPGEPPEVLVYKSPSSPRKVADFYDLRDPVSPVGKLYRMYLTTIDPALVDQMLVAVSMTPARLKLEKDAYEYATKDGTIKQTDPYGEFHIARRRAAIDGSLHLLAIFGVIFASIAGWAHDCLYRRRHPEAARYRFGYGMAYFLLAFPFCLALRELATPWPTFERVAQPVVSGGVLFSVPVWFLFRRKKGTLIDGLVCSVLFVGALVLPQIALALFPALLIYAVGRRKSIWSKPHGAIAPEPGPAYLIHDGDIQSGPFSLEEIRAALKGGRIPAIAYYWCDGMPEWTPIEHLPMVANSTASTPPMSATERSDAQPNRPAKAPVQSKRVHTARPLALGQNRFPRVHRSHVLWALGVFCLVAILWATHGRIWSIITPARPPAPADAAPPPQAQTVANRPSAVLPMETLQFSLSKNGVRHRAGCKYFSASQLCGPTEGRACKVCGG